LLPLPSVVMGQGPASPQELGQGFALTGHFLLKGLEPVLFGQALPAARMRLIDMLNDKA
jgi:DNA repair protein RecO (recombination protein O)